MDEDNLRPDEAEKETRNEKGEPKMKRKKREKEKDKDVVNWRWELDYINVAVGRLPRSVGAESLGSERRRNGGLF